MQPESAIPSFLNSLRSAGIELPPGIIISNKNYSVKSEDPAVPCGSVWQTGNRASAGSSAASVLRGVDLAWLDDLVNVGASSSSSRSAPPEPQVHMVSFAESVERADDDCASISSEKPPPQEGLRAVLRLLYQLCPSSASAALVRSQRACDFERLFATESSSRVEEPPPVLFHCITELWSQA